MAIYDELVARMMLLPDDRESLRVNRGFTDDMIDTYRLRSCDQHVTHVIAELRTLYTDEQLIESKLVYDKHGNLVPNAQLVDRNVLIPYLNQDGTVRKVRPHKLGFSGDGAAVFRTRTSYGHGPVCILAESEFKTIAAEALGYPAVSVPGISAMGGQNLAEFLDVMRTLTFAEIVVCFDNEVKDNPEFKNFKPRWKDRYDTIIWAYLMAARIASIGKQVRIATLPSEWMIDGKIDIDTALSQGRKPHEFAAVISNAVIAEQFIKIAPIEDTHRWYVNRRIRNDLFKSPIFISNGCYCIADTKGEEVRLSNFTINIKRTYTEAVYDPFDMVNDRLMTVKDMYGIESRAGFAPNTIFSAKKTWQSWVSKMGNYLLYGRDDLYPYVWDYIFNTEQGDTVHRIRASGYVESLKMWVFRNVIIKDGVEYYPDDDGVFCIDDVCYSVDTFTESSVMPAALPLGKEFDVHTFLGYLRDTVDMVSPGMADTLFGWVLACVFSDALIQKYKFFPLFFFYGNKTSGKTTVMRWLQSFMGMQHMNFNLKTTSLAGISRGLQNYYRLPLAVDDWRNSKDFRHYIEYFLGVYDRQRGLKATARKGETVVTNVNALLAIMGEELIMDGGVLSRCLLFYMPQQELRKVNRMNEMIEIIDNAGSFTLGLLRRQKELIPAVLRGVEKYEKILRDSSGGKGNSRKITNYAMVLGAYEAVLGENADMLSYCVGQVNDAASGGATGELDRVHVFIEELLSTDMAGRLPPGCFNIEGDRFIISMRVACDAVNNNYHRGDDNTMLLIKLIMSQSYFIENAVVEIGGRELPCLVMDIARMPNSMRTNVRALGRGFSLGAL